MTTTMAVEFVIGAATQAPDRLMIASSLTRVAWRSSPRWQARTAEAGRRAAAFPGFGRAQRRVNS